MLSFPDTFPEKVALPEPNVALRGSYVTLKDAYVTLPKR